MRLLAHLVWHDLRSQRLALLAFGAFLVVDAVSMPGDLPVDVRRFGEALLLLRALLVALVTGLVIQQDALTGTTAFWRTRPIGRAMLLTSKMTTLALVLLAAPGLVTWFVWLRLGVSGADAMTVVLGVVVENATLVLLTALAASVTPSLTHLVIAGVAGGTMVMLINTVLLPALTQTWPFVGQSLGGYRPAVYLSILFAIGAPTVAYQYLRLREWHTALLAGLAIVAATVVTRMWPVSPTPMPAVDPSVLDPARMTVALVPGSVQRTDGSALVRGRPEQQAYVRATVTAEGHPPDVMVWADHTRTRLLLRDRTEVWEGEALQPVLPPGALTGPDIYRNATNAVLGSARLPELATRQTQPPRAQLAGLSAAVLDRYAGQRALLTADLTLVAVRLRPTQAVRLEPGARLTVKGGAATVSSAQLRQGTLVVRLRVASVWPSEARPFETAPFVRVVLRHPGRHEAVQASRCRVLFPRFVSMLGGIRADVSLHECSFGAPASTQSSSGLDAAWLAGAEWLSVETERLGTFTKKVQTEFLVTR